MTAEQIIKVMAIKFCPEAFMTFSGIVCSSLNNKWLDHSSNKNKPVNKATPNIAMIIAFILFI